MTLGLEMITVDCTDPATLAQWWAEAVGGSVVPLPGGDFVLVVREWSWQIRTATRSAWQHPDPEPSLDSPL